MGSLSRDVVLAKLERGSVILVTYPNSMKVSEKTTYSIDGRGLTEACFSSIKHRLLPQADGLWGDATPQTYRLNRDWKPEPKRKRKPREET